MPVERGPRYNTRSGLILGVTAAVLAGGLFLLFSWLSSTGKVEVRLGDDVFEAGRTDRIATEIADRGPILYSDVAGGTRDLYLNHLGDEPDEGWVAFSAQQPGAARDCFLRWSDEEGVFVDECDGAEFPPDGEGLTRYEVFLEDDGEQVVVDINGVRSATTTPPTTAMPPTTTN